MPLTLIALEERYRSIAVHSLAYCSLAGAYLWTSKILCITRCTVLMMMMMKEILHFPWENNTQREREKGGNK